MRVKLCVCSFHLSFSGVPRQGWQRTKALLIVQEQKGLLLVGV